MTFRARSVKRSNMVWLSYGKISQKSVVTPNHRRPVKPRQPTSETGLNKPAARSAGHTRHPAGQAILPAGPPRAITRPAARPPLVSADADVDIQTVPRGLIYRVELPYWQKKSDARLAWAFITRR